MNPPGAYGSTVEATLTQREMTKELPKAPERHARPIEALTTPKVPVVLGLPDRRVVKGWLAVHIMGRRTFWHVADEDAPYGLRVRLIDPEPVWWMPCEGGKP